MFFLERPLLQLDGFGRVLSHPSAPTFRLSGPATETGVHFAASRPSVRLHVARVHGAPVHLELTSTDLRVVPDGGGGGWYTVQLARPVSKPRLRVGGRAVVAFQFSRWEYPAPGTMQVARGWGQRAIRGHSWDGRVFWSKTSSGWEARCRDPPAYRAGRCFCLPGNIRVAEDMVVTFCSETVVVQRVADSAEVARVSLELENDCMVWCARLTPCADALYVFLTGFGLWGAPVKVRVHRH